MKHKVAVIAAVLLVGLMLTFPNGQKEVAGQGSCPPGQTYEPCFSDRYDDGYCTCYVEKKALQSGLWSYDKLGGLGHAGEWDNNAPRNGLKVGLIPYPNSIAIWEAGPGFPIGHVAYVESISKDPKDGFDYRQMNGCNASCLNCVSWGHQNAKEAAAGTLHFIYPPTQNPQRLWPYEGFKIAYRTAVPPSAEVVNLQWYGGTGSYDLAIEVQRRDGNGNPIGGREILAERFNLATDRFNIYDLGLWMCPTIPPGTWYWRVKNAGSSNWSEWYSFELTWCDGSCAVGALTNEWGIETELGLTQGYCPAGNPTPMPTSTPWPTATAVPQPTPTQVQPTNTPRPSPGELRQASDLHFSPENPLVGQQVRFWFLVRNGGGEVVTFTEIGPYGHGWEANSHGYHALNPGEIRTINTYSYFDEPGAYTVDGIHYQLLSDSEPQGYYGLPSDGYTAAGIEIRIIEPTPTLTPPPPATPTTTLVTPTVVPTWTPGPTDTPPATSTPTRTSTTTPPPLPPPPTPTTSAVTPTVSTATATPCASSLKDLGDVNCDCRIDVADIQLITNHWRARRGETNYEERLDLNHDTLINIIDVQLVSSRWGEICSN